MDDRTIELETTVAYQGERIAKLEKIVSTQELELHKLKEAVERIRKQVIELEPSLVSNADDEAPPPHY
ncbi:MAG: SlyX family protein [Myxococcota bacterium]